MFTKETRSQVLALVFLSLGGWILHWRVHPLPTDPANPQNPANVVPFIAGLLGVIVVPFLISMKRTWLVGYLANGIVALIGVVTMATLSLSHPPAPLTLQSFVFGTMLSSILLLFAKLFIGQSILLHYHPKGMGRLFTPWWWTRHIVYLSAVFALGHFLWR